MKKSVFSLKFVFALGFIALVQFLTLAHPQTACANNEPKGAVACDPEFMESLRQRAWREAQREVMVNETFIFKPDSVFHLSCFDTALNAVPKTFSANGGNLSAVTQALSTYMNANFNHGTLGGATGAAQPTGNCGVMRSLWIAAKCRNLITSNFTAFAFDITSEPRIDNPQTCTTNPTATWDSTKARLEVVGAIQPFNEGTTFDTAKLFLPVTDPLDLLKAPGTCSDGIKTGVLIGSGGTTYEEIVCPNPGCVPTYEGNALVCKPQ